MEKGPGPHDLLKDIFFPEYLSPKGSTPSSSAVGWVISHAYR